MQNFEKGNVTCMNCSDIMLHALGKSDATSTGQQICMQRILCPFAVKHTTEIYYQFLHMAFLTQIGKH